MTDRPLRVGDVLYGFCGGAFGRDSYGTKRVEAIGADWVVAREDDGGPLMCPGDPERLTEYRDPPDLPAGVGRATMAGWMT
jgi:hypothetical protein